MKNLNVAQMKYIEAIELIDTLNTKKALSDSDMEQALAAMANLAPIIKNEVKWNDLRKKMDAYLKANPEQFNVSVKGVLVMTTNNTTTTETQWDADAIKKDGEVEELKLNCKEEYKKYFKTPTVAINPNACANADAAFKQKYGSQKTTVKPIISFN